VDVLFVIFIGIVTNGDEEGKPSPAMQDFVLLCLIAFLISAVGVVVLGVCLAKMNEIVAKCKMKNEGFEHDWIHPMNFRGIGTLTWIVFAGFTTWTLVIAYKLTIKHEILKRKSIMTTTPALSPLWNEDTMGKSPVADKVEIKSSEDIPQSKIEPQVAESPKSVVDATPATVPASNANQDKKAEAAAAEKRTPEPTTSDDGETLPE